MANAAIPRQAQLENIMPPQYGADLFIKAICTGDLYEYSTLNKILIEGSSVRQEMGKKPPKIRLWRKTIRPGAASKIF